MQSDKQKQWFKNNKEQQAEYHHEYYTRNKDKLLSQNKERKKIRRATIPNEKIKDNLRKRLNNILKSKQKGKLVSAVHDLGCSVPEYLVYLESRFTPEMTWENYGKVWHLDHIIPLAAFDLTDKDQQLKAINYKNTQPMLVADNMKKSDSLPDNMPDIKIDPEWSPEFRKPPVSACRAGGVKANEMGVCARNNLKLRKSLIATHKETGEVRFYLSACHASKDIGCSRGNIAAAAGGKTRIHSVKGWEFKFVDKSKVYNDKGE